MTLHLNRLNEMVLDETVQMMGHKICFNAELTKTIPNYYHYSLLSRALPSGRVVLSAVASKKKLQELSPFEKPAD